VTISAGTPEVSVIVAIKDSQRFLPQALHSIATQSFQNYEIIVVDGGSRDNGPAIARSQSKTVCILQSGTGLADAWNNGISAARGRFIAFLDSDDLWTPIKLDAQLAVFARDPLIEYVFGRMEFFVEPGICLPAGFRQAMLSGSHLAHFTGLAMIRRRVVERIGPFNTQLRITSDIAWFAKLRDSAVTGIVDDVLLRKRIHDGNLSVTTSWPVFKSELFEVLKTRIDEGRLTDAKSAANRAVDLPPRGS
jgi:glycosyltransferase involved in cell wall biosynthesis